VVAKAADFVDLSGFEHRSTLASSVVATCRGWQNTLFPRSRAWRHGLLCMCRYGESVPKERFPMLSRAAALGVFVTLLLSVASLAGGHRLEIAAGLRLELSDEGRVAQILIGGSALPLRGTGGLAIADFKHQPAAVNLVPNAGFEDGATGWRLAQGQSLDSSVAHFGQTSARLEVAGPETASSNLEVVVPAKPNTRYRVGMWLRRQGVGVCGAYASERDENGRLSGKQSQVGTVIPKQDGVWLPLAWEIVTEPATRRLSLRADIYRSTGTLWLDDYFIEEVSEGVYEPVAGKTQPVADGVALQTALPERGLEVDAVVRRGKDCLRIDGEVRDTTGEDRALGVRFALPLDLAGWTWHRDAEERESIQAGPVYRHTYKCRTGIGVCSIYPWSAVTGPDAGLSLALPLAQGPRVFLLQHDQNRRETSLTFFLGLAKDAGRHPGRAPFSFVLYAHDPAWGMRSAMETYYRLFPESFVKRPTFEGYLNYANMERFDPANHALVVNSRDALDDASDFGEGYKFLWHLHGCYDFRQVAYDDPNPKRPDDEIVFGLLREMATAEASRRRDYTPTAETLKKIVFGPRGEISYIGDTRYWRAHEGYNHTDQPGWGLNFRVNEDPDVSPFLAKVARRKAEEYARTEGRRDWDATFTADAIEGYFANMGGPDYRREHFRTTRVPLAFGYENLQPCLPNTIWDFHHAAWWPITEQYKIATYGNANGYEQFFTMPFVDVPMTEGNWDPKHQGRLDRFMRAVNYRKIWRYWHAWNKSGGYGDRDPANVQAHFRGGLACAIYPAVACVQSATGDLEPHRAWYRQYVPAIEELSTAGWEPVPYAKASEGVVVERFGDFARGELHFTFRNYADRPVDAVLGVDWKSLGVGEADELVAIDIVPRTPQCVPVVRRDDVHVVLEADGARALWIGTRVQAAHHGFRLAAATLEKIRRLFASELDSASTAALDTAGQVAQVGVSAKGRAALDQAESLQQAADRLAKDLKTRSPVDLQKLLFRLRAEVSLAPVALLELELQAPRIVGDARKGQAAAVAARFVSGTTKTADIEFRVASPWPEIAERSRVRPAATPRGGQSTILEAGLWVPADPPRRLMPCLLEARGTADGLPFTIATPVDVQVGPPLDIKLMPERVVRGQASQLKFSITNRLAEEGQLAVAFVLPAKATLEPATWEVSIAGQTTIERELTLTLDQNVPIGDLRITYRISSHDPRFNTQGPIFLSVDAAKE